MSRLFLLLVFILPFQARIYKSLKPLSHFLAKWSLPLPAYFEIHADLFISDFLILALLSMGLYLGRSYLKLLWGFEQKTICLFAAVAFLSILFSRHSPCLISYWRWGHLVIATSVLYFLGSWTGVRLKSFATVVVCSAVLECAVALPQYFLQHHIGLKAVGEPTLISRHYTGPHFHMPKKGVTSIGYYWNQSSEPSIVLRATGTLPHANVLGGFLVFSLLMTCFLYEQVSRKKLIGAALILQIVTLFTTYSRSGLFAFLGGALVWAFLHYRQERKIARAMGPIVVGCAASMLLFFPQIFYRGGVVSYNATAAASDGMRAQMQNVASLMLRDHPLLGVGFNNYLVAFAEYAKTATVDPLAVHNIYLLIAVETGLIGLVIFLSFCAAILWKGWQMCALAEGRVLLAFFLAFLAIGAVDYHPVLQPQMRLIFFLAAGLISLVRETNRLQLRSNQPTL